MTPSKDNSVENADPLKVAIEVMELALTVLEKHVETDPDCHHAAACIRTTVEEVSKQMMNDCPKCNGPTPCLRCVDSFAAPPQAEVKPEVCGCCHGSGRMVRDPDIGTDQECFACDGTGVIPQAEVKVPQGWEGYVTVIDGQFTKPSRQIPDGTYALIDREAHSRNKQYSRHYRG